MKKINLALLGLALISLCVLPNFALAQSNSESITLTTYYPSPYGSYNELSANKLTAKETSYTPKNAADAATTETDLIEGKMYYNQTDHAFKYYNGTDWVGMGGGREMLIGTLTKNGDSTLACSSSRCNDSSVWIASGPYATRLTLNSTNILRANVSSFGRGLYMVNWRIIGSIDSNFPTVTFTLKYGENPEPYDAGNPGTTLDSTQSFEDTDSNKNTVFTDFDTGERSNMVLLDGNTDWKFFAAIEPSSHGDPEMTVKLKNGSYIKVTRMSSL